MNPYLFSILFLFTAAVCQALAAALAAQACFRRDQIGARRLMWAAFSLGATLLAVHHGYTLSLAAQTGLYDFRQATLAMLSGLLTAFAIAQLRRQA